MISITEKTADEICQEFRGLIEVLDEKVENEAKEFKELTDEFHKRTGDMDENGLKYLITKALYDKATEVYNNKVEYLHEEKAKYVHFIEVLMVGEGTGE